MMDKIQELDTLSNHSNDELKEEKPQTFKKQSNNNGNYFERVDNLINNQYIQENEESDRKDVIKNNDDNNLTMENLDNDIRESLKEMHEKINKNNNNNYDENDENNLSFCSIKNTNNKHI